MSRDRIFLLIAFLVIATMSSRISLAQCILANPSFEIGDPGANVFGGWNQLGTVGASLDATHGRVAAKVTGPNTGVWGISGYWQRLDTSPDEQWSITLRVWHSVLNTLTGQSTGFVNLEWYDGGGNLLDSKAIVVADANTPIDQVQFFSAVTDSAPSGTVAIHLFLGVLHDPAEPAPDVYFDQVTFDNLGPPTLDELEWGDFPGGRIINFSGRTWRVKGPGFYGPGPNLFCDSAACTWVDSEDQLHMTIQNFGGNWYSTEVTLEEPLGYGDYTFTTLGRLDTLHPDAVLGMFLWQYGPCFVPANSWWNPHNEFDIEFSRWGDPQNDIGQFVAQPFDFPGNISRFDATFGDTELTSHAFRWLPDRVECRSWRGGPEDESLGNMIHTWTYAGPHIPRPEQPRVHINLWQFTDTLSTTQEVVLSEFTFVPYVVAVPATLPGPSSSPRLSLAWPNPFGPKTTIRFTLPQQEFTSIAMYDIAGRHVRTLFEGVLNAGTHDVVWNGCNGSGQRVASGVYLYKFRAGSIVETARVVLLNR